ncbi:hypothetical protein CMI47_22255 [Candidatus Pacearchaeota archaeon]|nr:hypothetical protein [Candidatus Pacearchaeota archaeon]|tara:strand:+ start:14500 stop:15240 length:741 start_codon:yes stop_codon:yes gene_type:complete
MKDYNYSRLAKYYDILENVESIESFNPVLLKILRKHNVKSILDMTCGTGVQAGFLHKKGLKVKASDYNAQMIKIARSKFKKVDFRKGDIRTSKYGKFDAVISIFNAIGHLSRKDFEKAIRNIGKNLNDKGLYIFDIFCYDYMKKNFIKHEFIDFAKEVNDTKFVRFNNNKMDKKKKILTMNQKIYVQKGLDKPMIFKESWDLQIYSSKELKRILEKNGSQVVEFLDMSGKKYKPNSSLILTIARKK